MENWVMTTVYGLKFLSEQNNYILGKDEWGSYGFLRQLITCIEMHGSIWHTIYHSPRWMCSMTFFCSYLSVFS